MSRKAFIGLIVLALVSAAVGCGTQTKEQRGVSLFKTCTPCHGDRGQGMLEQRTPAIAGLPEWYLVTELTKFQKDIRGAHPDDNEGHRMRPMARSLYHPGDIEAVAAYVSKLHPVVSNPLMTGNVEAGKDHYTKVCIACHGADGRGQQAMGSPPLVGQQDWYLVAQLKKFKSGMRGRNPQDNTGAMMVGMANTLPDTAAMHDVVAYLKTMPR